MSNEEMVGVLSESLLLKYDKVLLQLGYGEPIVKIETKLFIEYWEEILFVSFQGFPLSTIDGLFFLEWIKNPKSIYTNFKLS